MFYPAQDLETLQGELISLLEEYNKVCDMHYSLDMSRGKPEASQLDISEEMLSVISKNADCFTEGGTDCRNYGIVDGIPEAKRLFAQLLETSPENVIVGGNSSLNLMYDTVVRCMLIGTSDGEPWISGGNVKFLCPCPGYDRHFAICETLGIEMINIEMTEDGPEMESVRTLVESDPSIKGIWCVPKYSNPDGITYSDDTVRAFASLLPAAPDFRIFWDNAYIVHDLYDDGDKLLNILEECEKAGHPDMAYVFMSTSKVSYPGSGVSALASSRKNIDSIRANMSIQTIGHDKMNMLRHVKFFGDAEGLRAYMKKHAEILRPKFEMVLSSLESELGPLGIAQWKSPKGGYFISLNILDGCAVRTIELCKRAGIVLTPAGAAFPYHKDPRDRNIRVAPSYPTCDELEIATSVLCLCVKIACLEKLVYGETQ